MQHRLRRLGFVSALLLALVMVMPTPQAEAQVQAQAGIPVSICSVSTITLTDDCGDAECQDCLPGCAHNCCHGPHAALAQPLSPRVLQPLAHAPSAVDEAVGAPGRLPGGPDHPPRG